MAHQLHYTSAPSGLEDRAGFQFVAASPGADAALRQAVTPYLAYRPPLSAPLRPTAAELARFPVTYCFQPTSAGLFLVRCIYLGLDYSGRYGNFLAHVVVATERELAGTRPIELWRSRFWADRPARTTLPELVDLPPGSGTEPQTVQRWLHDRGETAFPLLAQLVEATMASLDGWAGPVVLAAETTQTVASWVLAVSHSLPLARALELSFVTYTADPDRARAHLVGTTPDAWSDVASSAQVFLLDELDEPARRVGTPGRYATAVAVAWQQRDLAGIAALRDLSTLVGNARDDREAVMALVAISRGKADDINTAAVVDLLRRYADRLPESVWSGLADQTGDRLGFDLTLAVHNAAHRTGRPELAQHMAVACLRLALRHRTLRSRLPPLRPLSEPQHRATAPAVDQALRAAADPGDLTEVAGIAQRLGLPLDQEALRAGAAHAIQAGADHTGDLARAYHLLPDSDQRAALIDGAVTALETADDGVLQKALTTGLGDLLADRDWSQRPRVGGYVLASHGRRHAEQRLGVTVTLTDLGDRGLLPDGTVDHHVAEVWRDGPPGIGECLRLLGPDGLLSRDSRRRGSVLMLAQRALLAGNIGAAEANALARQLLRLRHNATDDQVAADASAVVALHEIINGQLSEGCRRLDRVWSAATPALVRSAARQAYEHFPAAAPRAQARILTDLPPRSGFRAQLIGLLTERGRDAIDITEVAVRLHQAGRPDRKLDRRVAKLVGRDWSAEKLRTTLRRRDPGLAAGLDKLLARSSRRPGLLSRFLRRPGG